MFYFDSRNSEYKTPLGSVPAYTQLSLTVSCTGENDVPVLLFAKDKEEPKEITFTDAVVTQDSRNYSYDVLLNDPGLYFYCFRLSDGRLLLDDGCGKNIIADGGNWFSQSVFEQTFTTPNYFKGGIAYQIFPDRFNQAVTDRAPSFPDRKYVKNKADIPFYGEPDDPRGEYVTTDYFGGDLKGITEKLDYIKSFGVDCIYLNPIFLSHSNHRYNTRDYRQIDPDLGTLDDFRELCSRAHGKGIKIVLDGVFSHTGSDSIYFNMEKRYGEGGAFNDPESPYRSWFVFGDEYKNGYRAWWDFPTLPEINEMDPSYIEYICGDEGVISYWIENGADGFRLDVADELPDEFIFRIRDAVKRYGNDKLLIGEVWENAVTKESYGYRRQYLLGKGLDGTMNYPFRTAILSFMKTGNAYDFCESVLDVCDLYPRRSLNVMWNSLSTHDTERAVTNLAGYDCDRLTRPEQAAIEIFGDELELAKKKLVCATALQFTLPGVPVIYYGDEIGMSGGKDPFNRAYFQWWDQDERLQEEFRKIAGIRLSSDVYKDANIFFTNVDDRAVGYVRYLGDERMLTLVNISDHEHTFCFEDRKYTLAPLSWLIEKI